MDGNKQVELPATGCVELTMKIELQKQLMEANIKVIDLLHWTERFQDKQEKATVARTEFVDGIVGRKA